MEHAVVNDLVDFMFQLDKEFDKRNYPYSLRMNIYALLYFHQFNGTRNDWKLMFQKITEKINLKDKGENYGSS